MRAIVGFIGFLLLVIALALSLSFLFGCRHPASPCEPENIITPYGSAVQTHCQTWQRK